MIFFRDGVAHHLAGGEVGVPQDRLQEIFEQASNILDASANAGHAPNQDEILAYGILTGYTEGWADAKGAMEPDA